MLTPRFAMIHSASVARWKDAGISGPEYETAEVIPCRVELAQRKVSARSAGGGAQEVIASGLILFPAGTRMEPESRITYDGRTFSVLSCEPIFGFRETHVEVTIK